MLEERIGYEVNVFVTSFVPRWKKDSIRSKGYGTFIITFESLNLLPYNNVLVETLIVNSLCCFSYSLNVMVDLIITFLSTRVVER